MKRQQLEGGGTSPAVYSPARGLRSQPAALGLLRSGSEARLGLREDSAGAAKSEGLSSNPTPSCVTWDKLLTLSELWLPLL